MRSLVFGILGLGLAAGQFANCARGEDSPFPPGWLPVARLDDTPEWSDFRKLDDRIHLYLPPGVENVRGVFVCYVFHSSDPRELARLWRFALVTVPWPFEYDLGHNDKRNGRYQLGHPVGNMGFLLRYLNEAAKETKHPELSVAPIVGWLGQNGAPLCNDLFQRAPQRVLAWSDAWYPAWGKYPDLIAKTPVASAWEFNNEKDRRAEREKQLPAISGKLTPPADLKCFATTYGFPHGIYSKYNFFAAYLDRCIQLRLPADPPPPGQPTKLRPVDRESGWAGDYSEIGEWNAIAPAREAKGMVTPIWMPDEYAAWMWRSYHSCKPDVKLTGPVIEYRKKDGKWGGPQCGLGYGGSAKSDKPLSFTADAPETYQRIEFHDGNQVVGTAKQRPWQVEGVKLSRGLHVLFAVGVTADGKRSASRPGFLIVE